jgi:hypothetical protein
MSTTFFLRIEPRTTSSDLTQGIAARIYDPLWTLGRQWQLGELLGEDAGSPTDATLESEVATLAVYNTAATQNVPYDPTVLPLETLVEANPVRGNPTRAGGVPHWTKRLRIDTGRAFLRALADANVSTYAAGFISAYSFQQSEIAAAHPDDARLLQVAAGRVPDGQKLYTQLVPALLAGDPLPTPPAIAPNDVLLVRSAANAWITWCSFTLFETASSSAWRPDTLDYDFSVATSNGTGATTLDSTEYRGGSLDWYDFDTRPQSQATDFRAQPALSGMPTGVRYRGMPNPRWWELEDASVDFGSVTAGASDAARLALIEFGLVYANDFFAIPMRLNVGSLCRVTSLIVTDTFGMRLQIRPAASGTGRQGSTRWSLFTLNQRDAAQPGTLPVSDLFFLPPSAQQLVADRPVEEVLLVRDEMANLAWAIERKYEGERGIAVERIEEAVSNRPITPPPNVGASLRYVLGTTVPPYWFPLVPQQGVADVRLQLEQMENQLDALPLGTLLNLNGPSLPDSVVPREGRQLLRDYVSTRWSNGKVFVWSRKRSQIGRGEGSSGLQFDVAKVIDEQ